MRNLEGSALRAREHPLELAVSRIIGEMPFLWVKADDPPGPASIRGFIERNAIARLSSFGKEPIDPPSRAWLGLHSTRDRVRGSGLWANKHVEEVYDPSFLDVLEKAADGESTTTSTQW